MIFLGYRETWFKNNKPNFKGKYKCVECKKYFSKADITVDHKIPKRKGGTDDLWNLQPMCRSCNSSKGARQSKGETAMTLFSATMHGDLHKAVGGMAKQKTKDALGFKYKR